MTRSQPVHVHCRCTYFYLNIFNSQLVESYVNAYINMEEEPTVLGAPLITPFFASLSIYPKRTPELCFWPFCPICLYFALQKTPVLICVFACLPAHSAPLLSLPSANCVLDTVLSTNSTSSHLVLTSALWGRHCHWPCLTGRKLKHRREGTCWGSHGWQLRSQGSVAWPSPGPSPLPSRPAS